MPASRGTSGYLSVEVVNIGGWPTHEDVALDSCAQFLAVAEYRLIPAQVRSVGHQLRAPACQNHIVGGHAGVGVVSLGGAPLAAPSIVTPGFREFHRLGRAMRVTLPTGAGGVVNLFVVYGYQGAEEDSDELLLTDRLLGAVLAEAQVVCVGQPVLVVGDLNADPGVVPCLAKCIASGRLVDLALAYSSGDGKEPDATCRFKLEEGVGTRKDFFAACPNALAASTSCGVTDWCFAPHLFCLIFLCGVCFLEVGG